MWENRGQQTSPSAVCGAAHRVGFSQGTLELRELGILSLRLAGALKGLKELRLKLCAPESLQSFSFPV